MTVRGGMGDISFIGAVEIERALKPRAQWYKSRGRSVPYHLADTLAQVEKILKVWTAELRASAD